MNTRTPSTSHLADRRIGSLETLIHDRGVIGSKTVLSTLHYMAHRPIGGFVDEKQEKRALHLSRLVDQLSDDVLVLPKMGVGRLSTALVSRLRYPHADRERTNTYLAGLRALGPKATIGHALEKSIPDALQSLFPKGVSIVPTSTKAHSTSNDVIIRIPGMATFNIELRNWRSGIHDTFAKRDRFALERDQEIGHVTVFVVPMSTIRFKNTVMSHGGFVIDSSVYVVSSDQQKAIWESYRWGGWETKTITEAIPTIAESIANTILTHLPSAPAVPPPVPRLEPDSSLSIAGSAPTPRDLMEMALVLHESGTVTQREAALLIGCSPSALSRAFTYSRYPSPWTHGGRRTGAGRNSSFKKPRLLLCRED